MSMGGGTTTATSTPWGPAQPALQSIIGNAGNLFNSQAPSAGMSPITQGALGMTAERALNGSPLIDSAQNSLQGFLSGGQMNPYLSQMTDTALGKVRDMVNSQFEAAGRLNSGANQQELTRNLGEVASNMYGSQYNADQNRTLAAAQMAPSLANQDYLNLQQLLGVGQAYDQAPWSLLGNYANTVNGTTSPFGTKAQTAPSQSMIPGLLGMGLSLATNPLSLFGTPIW